MDQHDLGVLLKSRVPLIVMETREEARALALLEKVCNLQEQALFIWSIVDGLKRSNRTNNMTQTNNLVDCLRHIDATPQNGVYVLLDAHPFLQDPLNVRLVREIAMDYNKVARTLVFISPRFDIPPELKRLCGRTSLGVPDAKGVREILKEEAALYAQRNDEQVRGTQDVAHMLVQHLTGLPQEDVRRLLRSAIEDDGALTAEDLPRVLRAKRDLLDDHGILDLQFDCESFAAVGGLANLKRWLELRRLAFVENAAAAQLPVPKGVMLLGVQGSGKSLAAKAVAGTWRVPLLRLDFGALYNKYLGETERNLREVLHGAEAMAPCVLWIDEIEKGLATDENEGASRRVLGTLLTWMSERKSKVFMVATANDVTALPPELLRKGRFDELFFVDLPDEATRAEILRIHLERRQLDVKAFDTAGLAQASTGFSGAELEQAIVAALYEAYAAQEQLSTALLLQEIKATKPLSVLRAEEIDALREWASQRAVLAG